MNFVYAKIGEEHWHGNLNTFERILKLLINKHSKKTYNFQVQLVLQVYSFEINYIVFLL